MTFVIYNELVTGCFFLSYTAMKRFNKLGYKLCEEIPRHHPLLVSLYEKDKNTLEGIGCQLNIKEIKGSVYTIVTVEYGKEKVMEPEDFKWTIISS